MPKTPFTIGGGPLTFNETMKRSKKHPYLGITQGGSSKRPKAGAVVAATGRRGGSAQATKK